MFKLVVIRLSQHSLIPVFILVGLLLNQAECGSRLKTAAGGYLTSLLSRALGELASTRNSKWNEFIEEQQTNKVGQVKNPADSNRTSVNLINESMISETKDPNSPYYIATITSNIGGSHSSLNRSSSNSGGGNNSGSSNNQQGTQSGSNTINKLFSSATGPSRVLQATKRPLITYINISNLEEHDSELMAKLGNLSEDSSPQLHLLNNADPGSTVLQLKRRLPECATQQVCSAHYVKSNHTQRLCECSQDFNWNCDDAIMNEDHTIDLTRKQEYKEQRSSLEVYTQVKLCENLKTMKPCKTPTDWTIMALQSERTGKAHYVVVCKCPDAASFEGPFTHKHPPYARFPGIRVYGMLCNQGIRKSKNPKEIDQNGDYPEFPWELAYAVINSTTLQGFW